MCWTGWNAFYMLLWNRAVRNSNWSMISHSSIVIIRVPQRLHRLWGWLSVSSIRWKIVLCCGNVNKVSIRMTATETASEHSHLWFFTWRRALCTKGKYLSLWETKGKPNVWLEKGTTTGRLAHMCQLKRQSTDYQQIIYFWWIIICWIWCHLWV